MNILDLRYKKGYKSKKTTWISGQTHKKVARNNRKNLQSQSRKLRLMWHLYIIKKNEKFYTGITTNLKNRLHQHGNPPLLYKEVFPDKYQAAQREKQIKGFSKVRKQKLIKGLLKWVYTACPPESPRDKGGSFGVYRSEVSRTCARFTYYCFNLRWVYTESESLSWVGVSKESEPQNSGLACAGFTYYCLLQSKVSVHWASVFTEAKWTPKQWPCLCDVYLLLSVTI